MARDPTGLRQANARTEGLAYPWLDTELLLFARDLVVREERVRAAYAGAIVPDA